MEEGVLFSSCYYTRFLSSNRLAVDNDNDDHD